MDKLIELTKDVWHFGCKGDVLRLSAERLQALEVEAEKLGTNVYVEVKDVVTAAARAAVAVEAEVVDEVKAEAPKVAEAAKEVKDKVASAVEGKKK